MCFFTRAESWAGVSLASRICFAHGLCKMLSFIKRCDVGAVAADECLHCRRQLFVLFVVQISVVRKQRIADNVWAIPSCRMLQDLWNSLLRTPYHHIFAL